VKDYIDGVPDLAMERSFPNRVGSATAPKKKALYEQFSLPE